MNQPAQELQLGLALDGLHAGLGELALARPPRRSGNSLVERAQLLGGEPDVCAPRFSSRYLRAWCPGSAPRRCPAQATRRAPAGPASPPRRPLAHRATRSEVALEVLPPGTAAAAPQSSSEVVGDLSCPVRKPRPSGLNGTNPIPSSRAGGTTRSRSRVHSDHSLWTARSGARRAARTVSPFTSDSPRYRTFPASPARPSRRRSPRSAPGGRGGAGTRGRRGPRRAGAATHPGLASLGQVSTSAARGVAPAAELGREPPGRGGRPARGRPAPRWRRAVHVGGVEEGAAGVERALDVRDGLGLVGRRRRTGTSPCSRGRGRRRPGHRACACPWSPSYPGYGRRTRHPRDRGQPLRGSRGQARVPQAGARAGRDRLHHLGHGPALGRAGPVRHRLTVPHSPSWTCPRFAASA